MTTTKHVPAPSRLTRFAAWAWHVHDNSIALWAFIAITVLAGSIAILIGAWKP